uniref:Ovarian tumour, otubain, putative n=1 Tax=Medicago truncatula TaxID=3880 RepID=Q2HU38_MEDTR|nr:Ovarian tumour, otubain, putative [Medicago truncatula]
MCLGLIPNYFVLLFLKDGCPLPPSSTEWNNHKSDEASTWEFEYLDQQARFRELMKIEKGLKSPLPKKKSNQANPIFCDTPEKEREEFQVIGEDEEDSISLDAI